MELGSLQEDLLSLLWAADSLHAGASLGSAVLCRLGCNGHVPLLCSRLDPSSSMRNCVSSFWCGRSRCGGRHQQLSMRRRQ